MMGRLSSSLGHRDGGLFHHRSGVGWVVLLLELVCRTRPMCLSNHGLPSSWAVKAAGCTRHGAQDCIRDRALTGGPPAPPSQGVPSWALKLFSCSPYPAPFVCVSLPIFFPHPPLCFPFSLSLVSHFPVFLHLFLCLSISISASPPLTSFLSSLGLSVLLVSLSGFCFLGLLCLLLSMFLSLSYVSRPLSLFPHLCLHVSSLFRFCLSLFLSPSSSHRPHGDPP